MGLNSVCLQGHLTKHPELRYTPSGTPVCTFPLAVNRKWRSGEELKEEVCYVDIVTFSKQAETHAQHLQKGSHIVVEGRLQQRRWETDDGQKRSKHEVVATSISYLNRANGQKGQAEDHGGGEDMGDEG